MLNVNISMTGEKALTEHIAYVRKLISMKTDKGFQKFIQEKCLNEVKTVARERLGGTTNDEYIAEYINRNKIEELSDGFILYNDLVIPAVLATKNTKNQNRETGMVRNYDSGFSLALAFEYGVGIVGQNNPIQGAWEYNVNNYGPSGWYYKTPSGESIRTQGYKGAEVYRYTAERIKNNLKTWVNEYFNKKEV